MPKLRPSLLWIVLCTHSLWAQQYLISTVAGGGVPGFPAPALTSGFDPSYGIALDAPGNVYFTSGERWVLRVDRAGVLTRVAGTGTTGYSGDGGPASNAQLNNPRGLAFDSKGNLYIADERNGRLRRVSPEGIITTVSILNRSPRGVAVDSKDNVYVTGDQSVFKILANGLVTRVAGDGGASGAYSGDGGPAVGAQLNNPQFGLALDGSDNLYIADTFNNRIRKVSSDGIISTFAGTGTAGFGGDGGPAISAQLNRPFGIAFDRDGNLYITEEGMVPGQGLTFRKDIRKVSSAGIISTVTTQVSGNSVAVDRAGNLYLAGRAGGTTSGQVDDALFVRKYSTDGTVTVLAGNGTQGSSSTGDGGPATNAQLGMPYDVAVDHEGNFYVAEAANHRIRKVSSRGIITTVAGTGTAGFSGDLGQAVAARLSNPRGLAIDRDGNLYVLDAGNQRIRKVSAGGVITTVAGNPAGVNIGDGKLALETQLRDPSGIALDSANDLYIAERSNRVRKVSSSGIITTVAGNGTSGFSGDGGPAVDAQLWNPIAIAIDRDRNLYIVDAQNFRVRRVSAAGIITTVAGNASRNFFSDGVQAVNTPLYNPTGITVDGAGNFFVVDLQRIAKVTPNGIIAAVGGSLSGASDIGDGGLATNGHFSTPQGIAVDDAGNIFVADTGHNLIRLLQPLTPSLVVNVNGASFVPGTAAPDSFVTATGQGLATGIQSTGMPFPTNLGGTVVRVKDSLGAERLALVTYVQPDRVNYIVPAGTAFGPATVSITAGDGRISIGPLQIGAISPGVFLFGGTNLVAANVVRLNASGQNVEDVYAIGANGAVAARPIDLGPETDQVALVLYCTGIRGHGPDSDTVVVNAGGVNVAPFYADRHPLIPGLDQINILLPRSLIGRGNVTIQVMVDRQPANTGTIFVR